MRFRSSSAFVALYFALLLASSAFGQEPLSVQEAVRRGLEGNYAVRLARKQAEIDRTNDALGQAGLYPEVFAEGASRNASTYRQPSNPFALAGVNRSYVLSGSLNASWTLFDGFRVWREKDRLVSQRALSERQERLASEIAAEAVVNAYYRVQLEAAKLETQREVVSISRRRYEYVLFQYETGRADLFDVSQEESRYLSDSLALEEQALARNDAFRSLNLEMGAEDPEARYRLTDSLRFDPVGESYNALLEAVKDRNAGLVERKAALRLAERELDLSRADPAPEVTLDLGYGGSHTWFNAEFPVGEDENGDRILERQTQRGHDYGPFANLTARYTIFDGGRLQRAVETAQIRRDMARLRVLQTEQAVTKRFADAYDLYATRVRQLEIARQSRRAAATSLDLAADRLENGAISAFDYRQIQTAYLDAANAQLDALFNAVAARTALSRLTGRIIEE